jgi:hypothetical protein
MHLGGKVSSSSLLRSPSVSKKRDSDTEIPSVSLIRDEVIGISDSIVTNRSRDSPRESFGPNGGEGAGDHKGLSSDEKEGMLRVGVAPETVRGSLASKPPLVVRRNRQGVLPLLFEFAAVTTVENLHTYLWILKDLSWAQAWYLPGWVCGSNAVLLSSLVCMGSLMHREFTDLWHNVAQLLWLSANFVWMAGDLHDATFPDEPPSAARGAQICAMIMILALCWLSVYFTFLHPLQILEDKKDSSRLTIESSYLAKMLCFSNWRYFLVFL